MAYFVTSAIHSVTTNILSSLDLSSTLSNDVQTVIVVSVIGIQVVLLEVLIYQVYPRLKKALFLMNESSPYQWIQINIHFIFLTWDAPRTLNLPFGDPFYLSKHSPPPPHCCSDQFRGCDRDDNLFISYYAPPAPAPPPPWMRLIVILRLRLILWSSFFRLVIFSATT